MYLPPELRELVYDKADQKTKARFRVANRGVQARPKPLARGDYLKGTGKYQKIWNELPKKTATAMTTAPLQFDSQIATDLNYFLRMLKRLYKQSKYAMITPASFGFLIQTWSILGLPLDFKGSITEAIDLFLPRADELFKRRDMGIGQGSGAYAEEKRWDGKWYRGERYDELAKKAQRVKPARDRARRERRQRARSVAAAEAQAAATRAARQLV